MVYMDPQLLGWRPLMQSWLNSLPRSLDVKYRKRIETLFEWMVMASEGLP